MTQAASGDSVSVVIPCRNEGEAVVSLLDALCREAPPVHEIVVVDNASSDDTAARVRAWTAAHPGAPLRFVTCVRIGQPAALNAGIRIATGDIIVRVDAHSRPDETYVPLAVATLQETEAGIVGGVWRIEPGSQTATARAIAVAASHPLGAGDAAYRIGGARPGRRAVDTVPFGCFYRSTWAALGGFNERILTNEDYEFAYRVRRSGRQVILDPRMQCVYRARPTIGALGAQYFRYGWWKGQMLRWHPRSLRWRQAVPAGFVACLLALLCVAPFVMAARAGLAALMALYGGTLLAAGIKAGIDRRDAAISTILPATFATIHVMWGLGALVNLFSAGRLPRAFGRLARPHTPASEDITA